MVHFVQPDNINLGQGDSDEDDDGSDEEDFEDYERRVSGHFNSGNNGALITSNFPAYQLSTDMRDDYDDGAMGITKRKTDASATKKKKEESKSMLTGAGQTTPGKNRKTGVRSSNATDLLDPRDQRMSKSMHSDNIDLLSRDDSINLGMGHLSVRNLVNSEI